MIYEESAMSKNIHGHKPTINPALLLGLVMGMTIPLNLDLLANGEILSNDVKNNQQSREYVNPLIPGGGLFVNPGTERQNILTRERISLLASEIGAIEIPVPPPETTTLTKYRVLVATNNPKDVELVRVLFPDAFSIVYNGQSMLQVGLFNSQDRAIEALEALKLNGFRGVIVNEALD